MKISSGYVLVHLRLTFLLAGTIIGKSTIKAVLAANRKKQTLEVVGAIRKWQIDPLLLCKVPSILRVPYNACSETCAKQEYEGTPYLGNHKRLDPPRPTSLIPAV